MLPSVNTAIATSSRRLRGHAAASAVRIGAPIVAPMAKAATAPPIASTSTWRLAAMAGTRPMVTNSVKPSAKAESAKA